MPSSVGSAFLLFGIVLALAGAPATAVVMGGIGVLWEVFLFFAGGFE
jgi:hypothetical protein